MGRVGRYGAAVVGWVLAAVTWIAQATGHGHTGLPGWWAPVDLVVGAGLIVAMRWRRRHPLLVCWSVLLASIVCSSLVVALAWASISLATRRRWRQILVFFLAQLVAMPIAAVLNDASGGVNVTFNGRATVTSWPEILAVALTMALWVGLLTAIGVSIGARRDLIAGLRDRAETAEREQELRVLAGQQTERNRIAREMHDVLAHRLSLISMHAGALAWRDDLRPEETRQIAATIQENAHDGLEELRAVLGSLRSTDPDARPDKPQPTVAELPALVEQARAGGQRVRLEITAEDLGQLPTATGRHAFRVVQEGLTNARKHAPGCAVGVLVTGGPGEGLDIRVSNPLPVAAPARPVPGSGVGLEGLRERARMTGGRVSCGPTDDGRFDLEVWFPW